MVDLAEEKSPVIYAALAILLMAGRFGLWLWRKGKKEAYGETAQETIKAARKSAKVSDSVDRLSDAAVSDQLSNDWTKK